MVRHAQVHVHEHPLHGRHGHVVALGAAPGGDVLADVVGGELQGAILAEEAHGVGAAAGAVAHLLEVATRAGAHLGHLHVGELGQVGEGRSLGGDHGHAVVDVGAELGHGTGDVAHVVIVDAGDHHGVHLDDDAAGLQGRDAGQLARKQQFGSGQAKPDSVFAHAGVDLGADLGIHRVHRDRDVLYAQGDELFDIF